MSNDPVLIPLTAIPIMLPQEPTAPAPGPAAGASPAAGTTQAPTGDAGQGSATGGQQPCGTETFLMMGLFVALMWLMVLRPESKRRKETQTMLSALKQGDTVVTIGGMHGKVATIAEKTVVLRIDSLMLTFDRSAIARVLRDETPAQKG